MRHPRQVEHLLLPFALRRGEPDRPVARSGPRTLGNQIFHRLPYLLPAGQIGRAAERGKEERKVDTPQRQDGQHCGNRQQDDRGGPTQSGAGDSEQKKHDAKPDAHCHQRSGRLTPQQGNGGNARQQQKEQTLRHPRGVPGEHDGEKHCGCRGKSQRILVGKKSFPDKLSLVELDAKIGQKQSRHDGRQQKQTETGGDQQQQLPNGKEISDIERQQRRTGKMDHPAQRQHGVDRPRNRDDDAPHEQHQQQTIPQQPEKPPCPVAEQQPERRPAIQREPQPGNDSLGGTKSEKIPQQRSRYAGALQQRDKEHHHIGRCRAHRSVHGRQCRHRPGLPLRRSLRRRATRSTIIL